MPQALHFHTISLSASYCLNFIVVSIQGSAVMLVRCEEEEEDDEGDEEGSEMLQRGLMHQCSLALQVQGLPTGYCKDIHGQVGQSLSWEEQLCIQHCRGKEHKLCGTW